MNNPEAYKAYLRERKSGKHVNYYLESKKELASLPTDHKPTILLHACCAVCASYPLELLANYFSVTVFFNNSNIFPETEYKRRLAELKRYIQETDPDISLVTVPYDHNTYMEPLRPMQEEPEGWLRCFACYRLRMEQAYQYAVEHHFEWFTTVMSISRQKDSQVMNRIGHELEQKYPTVKYFYSDFKKGGGQIRQGELVAAHDLYRQDYCGCEYSYYSRHPKEGSSC